MSFLEKNLAALQAVNPLAASVLLTAPIPEDFERVAGTDGSPTFLRTTIDADGQKHLHWLGATSMPQASAESLIATLDASTSCSANNGLGLSIGTGYEWLAFAARLNSSQALFVYEPTVALGMALEICDLSALLLSRKLLLLTGTAEQASDTLARLLTESLGLEPPTVLHPLPTLGGQSPGVRNQMLAAGEAIVRHGVLSRQNETAGLVTRLTQAAASVAAHSASASPQVIAMTLTPRYPQERPIQEIIRKHRYPQLPLDRHDSASMALRMQKLAQQLEKGPVRILSDLLRGPLACVPPNVPVETWVPPLAGPGYWERFSCVGMESHDRIVVHAGDHQAKLLALGVKPEQIQLQPIPPCGSPKTAPADPDSAFTLRHRVALIADLPRSSADALGIVLPTHQAVYTAVKSLIADEFLTVHTGSAPDLLRRALARAGAGGGAEKDAALGEPILRLIREVLIPAIPILTLARQLADQGISVTIIGDWPDLDTRDADGDRVKLQPFGQPPREAWSEIAVLAHLSPQGTVSPLIWDATAAGVTLIAPEHPSDRQFGALPLLLKPNAEFSHPRPQQFITALKGLLRDTAQRQKFAESARNRLSVVI